MFSWDEAKDLANRKKHGVSFEAASFVFDDPFHVSRVERIEEGEQRWQTIGMVAETLLLLVAHTWEEESTGELQIRIISARRANQTERLIYEEGA
jgi:uncharacterized protein